MVVWKKREGVLVASILVIKHREGISRIRCRQITIQAFWSILQPRTCTGC